MAGTALTMDRPLDELSRENDPSALHKMSRHDSVISDEGVSDQPMDGPTVRSGPFLEEDSSRHDSVLGDEFVRDHDEEENKDPPPSSNEVPPQPNLGKSILQTPSRAGSSKASPTPSIQKAADLGVSTPKPRSATKNAETDHERKIAGSMWLSKYRGKLWPIVLCDQATAPEKFMQTQRNSFHLPAMLLGMRIYIWVEAKYLREYDPHRTYLEDSERFVEPNKDVTTNDSEQERANKLRQKAFEDDAPMYRDHEFWANVIQSTREARKMQEQMRGPKRRHLDAAAKGKQNSGEGEKLELECRRRKRPVFESDGSHPHKRPRVDLRRAEEDEAELDDGLFVFDQPATKPSKIEFDSDEKAMDFDEQERIQAFHEKAFEHKKGTCNIIVGKGEDKTIVPVPNAALGKCVELSRLLHYSDEKREDSYIKLYEHHDINAKTVEVLTDWLTEDDFYPKIQRLSNGKSALEGVSTPAVQDLAVKHISHVYLAASKLRLELLMHQCVNKLSLISDPGVPGVIGALKSFQRSESSGGQAELRMWRWLIDWVGSLFWQLVAEDGKRFAKTMQKQPDLCRDVFWELGKERAHGEDDEEQDLESE